MFYHCLYTLFRHKYLILVLLLWGCSSDPGDSPIVVGDDPDEVTVTFSAGNSSTLTRAPFPADTPLKIYVYRSDGGFSAAPYKIVEGKTGSTADSGLSSVILTGGNVTDGAGDAKLLTVRGGVVYDFIVVVNASSGAQLSGLGTLNSGMLTGFSHGADILSGRQTVNVAYGTQEVVVTFKDSYGADAQGNLPHLCSAVVTEARATQTFIDYIKTKGDFNYQVAGMDFKNCLPKSANLSFSGNPMALTPIGSATSYSASILGEVKTVTATADVATSADGVLLPCPLQVSGRNYNVMSIDFRLRVNGGEVTFSTTNVQVPEFKPGYRYRFIVEMDKEADQEDGVVKLLLSVESWSAVSWDAAIGGSGDTEVLMLVTLGSWSSVSWQSPMGGDGTDNLLIAGVSGWSSVTWASQMGEY